jgi:hypothetical protein
MEVTDKDKDKSRDKDWKKDRDRIKSLWGLETASAPLKDTFC